MSSGCADAAHDAAHAAVAGHAERLPGPDTVAALTRADHCPHNPTEGDNHA